MNFKLNTDGLNGAFSESDIILIRERFLDAAAHAYKFLAVDNVPVDFVVDPRFVDSPWSVAAYVPHGPERIVVQLHPDNFHLKDEEGRTQFSSVMNHEFLHIKRKRTRGGNKTLGDILVDEGLALNFEQETSHPIFNFGKAIPEPELRAMAETAKKSLDFTTSPKDRLFHGKNGETVDIDEYAVGRALIGGWLKYWNMTPSQAAEIPAKVVLKDWKEGKFDIDVEAVRPLQQKAIGEKRLDF